MVAHFDYNGTNIWKISTENPLSLRIWTGIKQKLNLLTHEELLALMGELFHLSLDNRQFLAARYPAQDDLKVALAVYQKKVESSFFIMDDPLELGIGDVDLAQGRKAINDYYQATHDPVGKLELMLNFLDTAVIYADRSNIRDESFYAGVYEMLDKLVSFIHKHDYLYAQLAEQITTVIKSAQAAVWEEVEWTLIQLELDLDPDDDKE